MVTSRANDNFEFSLGKLGGEEMQKIQQQRYRTISGEMKLNCYKITLSKDVVKQAGFDEKTRLETRAEGGRILIERAKENRNK